MKIKEIQQLGVEELRQKEKALKKELYALNYQRRLGQVEKPSRFHLIRRDIARILTIIKEREINGTKN